MRRGWVAGLGLAGVCACARPDGGAQRAEVPGAGEIADGDSAALGAAAADNAALEQAALAWQRGYEQALRDADESFLTAVGSHYLRPGQSVGLARLDAGQWAPSETPSVRFEVSADGGALAVERGEARLVVEARRSIPAGARESFVVSAQDTRWRVLVHDHDAPARRGFAGLGWFPVDARFVVEARFEPASERREQTLATSRGESKTVYLAGVLHFELAGQVSSLQAFAYAAEAEAGEELLVPFTDETTGGRSYAAGRYLELVSVGEEGGLMVLDFNRATNPLCAYSEHYNCPMPPRFNAVGVAVAAGALAPAGHG